MEKSKRYKGVRDWTVQASIDNHGEFLVKLSMGRYHFTTWAIPLSGYPWPKDAPGSLYNQTQFVLKHCRIDPNGDNYVQFNRLADEAVKAINELRERITLEGNHYRIEESEDYGSPSYSPWGGIQHRNKLKDGVYYVGTAGHGGIMVHHKVELSKEAFAVSEKYQQWQCFEEDCLYAVALWEMEDVWEKCKCTPPITRQSLLETISMYNPEYLIQMNVEPDPKNYEHWKAWKLEETMRAEHNPDLIVSACGDWYTKVEGVDYVVTADKKDHYITAESYHNIHQSSNLLLLSKCVQVEVTPEQISKMGYN
jgi:hypothetical protein